MLEERCAGALEGAGEGGGRGTDGHPRTPTSNLLARALRSELKRRQTVVVEKLEGAKHLVARLKDKLSDARMDVIGDESRVCIGITVWGDACEAQDYAVGQILALKACRVSDYSGKSLNASWDVRDLVLNLKHPRTAELISWQKGKSPSEMR